MLKIFKWMILIFTVEAVDTGAEQPWVDEIMMEASNGEVMMDDVMTNQETPSNALAVSIAINISL